MDANLIVQQLKELKRTALALYSQFHVAALLETEDGAFYAGVNIESSSYGLTICAERVAMFKALSEGERNFVRVYIMSDGNDPCPPCGACRQVLFDFAPEIEVVMVSEKGEMKKVPLKELLPYAFNDERLKR